MPALRTVATRDIATVHEVLKLCGNVPRSTLIRWRTTQDFPKPFKTVGKRVELWDLGHVRAWLAWRMLRDEPGVECRILEPGILEIREENMHGRFVVGASGGLRRVFGGSDKVAPKHLRKRYLP